MNRAAQIYDFVLTPGGSANLAVAGGYYRIMSATGPVRVRREGGSQLGPLYPGQGERQEFNRLTITDLSGAANTGYILVSDESFVDERITGEVSVINGERAKTDAGKAYLANIFCVASIGNYSHVQLFNPSASGRNVYVEQAILNTYYLTSPTNFYFKFNTAALAIANAPPGPRNKNLNGGNASASLLYFENNSAQLGTGFLELGAGNSSSFTFNPKGGPILLRPGVGLVVSPAIVNTAVLVQLDLYEEALA